MALNKEVDIEAIFLGPKGENEDIVRGLISKIYEDYIHWRRNFHPEDPMGVTEEDKERPSFKETITNLKSSLEELLSKLRESSMPFHSPRYLGHMTYDTFIPAILGYFAGLLYNPNNVAFEASPVTTEMEIEVGRDLASLIGFKKEEAWGHITAGGTIANFEALWVARNLKYLPIAVKKATKEKGLNVSVKLANGEEKDIISLSEEDLLRRVKPQDALSLKENLIKSQTTEKEKKELEDLIFKNSISQLGVHTFPKGLGKVLVPQSAHYCWLKAVEILGLGRDALEFIPVDEGYRMDIKILKRVVDTLIKNGESILAVVGTLGTTEEGAVDPVDKIISLRERKEKEENISFYVHIDAAYGGYIKSIFLDEKGDFLEKHLLQRKLQEKRIVEEAWGWPSKDLYNSFFSLKDVDSASIDPHKLGYIPYPGGAVVFKDERVKDLVACYAPYIFRFSQNKDENPQVLGMYIMEGSKPGASAAAVWLAHRVVPLNINGYGKVLGETVEGALRLHHALKELGEFSITTKWRGVNGRSIEKCVNLVVKPLMPPDLNIVCYAFNVKGNRSLIRMNKLNQELKENKFCLELHKPILGKDFIISSTEFTKEVYGNAPLPFLKSLGIDKKEWDKIGKVEILRSTVMTPYLTLDYIEEDYAERFINTIKVKLCEMLREGFFDNVLGLPVTCKRREK